MKNSYDKIGNRNLHLPACSTVPQPTVLFALVCIFLKKHTKFIRIHSEASRQYANC